MSIELADSARHFGTFTALRRRHAGGRGRRAGRAAGAVRLGQDDAAADHRRPGDAGSEAARSCFDGEDADRRAASRDRRVGFVFQHYALFRHMTVFENVAFGLRVRPRKLRPSQRRDPRQGARAARAGAAGWARRPLPLAALRRPAAARRARPGAGRRAAGAAAGRAVRRAGRQGPPGAAALAAPAARRHAHHQRLRDPRPGGGAGGRRPRGGA